MFVLHVNRKDVEIHIEKLIFKFKNLIKMMQSFILNIKRLKLGGQLIYFGSNISSTESDINIRGVKTWTAIDMLSIIWTSGLLNKIKQDFFPSEVVSSLLHC